MTSDLIQINVRNPLVRVVLIIFLIVGAVWSYFVVRWYLGNTFAEYFNTETNSVEAAQRAVSMAPDDPMTHWRMDQVSQKVLSLEQQAQAIGAFERAVSLSPNDYRYWMTLGIAYEQVGETAKAEYALKRAVGLAPSYAYPHWYLGNLLLRSSRYDEAFVELRRAAEADAELQTQQFNLVWEVYKPDPEALKRAIGDDSLARAKFALYLVNRQEFETGLKIWDGIGPDEKKSNKESGEALVNSLVTAWRYHDAVKVWNDLVGDTNNRIEIGRVFDGGFDDASRYGPEMPFTWQVQQVLGVQIGLDPTRSHSGASSLRLLFNVRTNLEGLNVMQLVPVAPGTEYEVEFYVKSEELETGGPPIVQIVDPTTSGVIVTSPYVAIGDSEWTRVALPLKTGDKTEALLIKIERPSCGTKEAPICPIFGSVWYDDFSFKRRN